MMSNSNRRGANTMPRTKSSGVNRTRQAGIDRLQGSLKADRTEPYIAQITKVFSDRNTCNIISLRSGQHVRDVPVMTKAGLVNDEVYGELDLPEIGDRVIVFFIENRESMPMILNTVIPFMSQEYEEGSQVAVNSSNKAYTLKLLETGKEKAYKRIFKSGATFEAVEDGSIVIETPSGTYVNIDETNNAIEIVDQHGNTFTLDTTGVIITDTNGNDVTMETGKVTINGNLEVLQ